MEATAYLVTFTTGIILAYVAGRMHSAWQVRCLRRVAGELFVQIQNLEQRQTDDDWWRHGLPAPDGSHPL